MTAFGHLPLRGRHHTAEDDQREQADHPINNHGKHRTNFVSRVLGGVVSFDQIPAGAAGHEAVIERADHVEHERARLCEADIHCLQQQMPAAAGDQKTEGQHHQCRQQERQVCLADESDEADIDQRIRDGHVISADHPARVNANRAFSVRVADEQFGGRAALLQMEAGTDRQYLRGLNCARWAVNFDGRHIGLRPDLIARTIESALPLRRRVLVVDFKLDPVLMRRVCHGQRAQSWLFASTMRTRS